MTPESVLEGLAALLRAGGVACDTAATAVDRTSPLAAAILRWQCSLALACLLNAVALTKLMWSRWVSVLACVGVVDLHHDHGSEMKKTARASRASSPTTRDVDEEGGADERGRSARVVERHGESHRTDRRDIHEKQGGTCAEAFYMHSRKKSLGSAETKMKFTTAETKMKFTSAAAAAAAADAAPPPPPPLHTTTNREGSEAVDAREQSYVGDQRHRHASLVLDDTILGGGAHPHPGDCGCTSAVGNRFFFLERQRQTSDKNLFRDDVADIMAERDLRLLHTSAALAECKRELREARATVRTYEAVLTRQKL